MARVFHPPPHLTAHLAGRTAAREARSAVSVLLHGSGEAGWHSDAALVVSELVSNALNACGQCEMSAWFLADDCAFRVEVVDSSPALPVEQPISSDRVGGHGLRIVDRLSSRWGVIAGANSKTVWFEIDG